MFTKDFNAMITVTAYLDYDGDDQNYLQAVCYDITSAIYIARQYETRYPQAKVEIE